LVDRVAETSTAISEPQALAERLRGLEPVRRLAGRNRTKADIVVHRVGDTLVALKDYSRRAWWLRQTLGRWLVRRETAAYRALSGVRGVPEFLGRVGAFALALRWIDARPLATIDPASMQPGWFDEIESILAEMHQRGVALGDLHHRDVLIGADGSVHIVDFAVAWVVKDETGPLRRAVFERFRDADRVALARMRARAEGRDPDAAVQVVGGRAARWHARGRRAKGWLNRLRGR